MHSNSTLSVTEPAFHITLFSTHTLENENGKTEIILPCALDSRAIRSVHFSFSGTLDHSTQVSPRDMLSSAVVRLFHRSLSLNAERLGIIDISEVILDDHPSSTLGIPKVFVTPARHACLRASSQAHVLSIHLAYNWKSFSQMSSGLSIFSPQTLLSLDPALDRLMRKLFSVHIVGYPWLFGPLRTKLHLEHQWFPSLVRSLLAITDRSENLVFRNKVQSLVKAETLAPSVSAATEYYPQKIMARVSDSLATTETGGALVLALELVLKNAARPPPFKEACLHIPTQSSNDETLDLHHLSEDFSGNTPDWIDLLPTDPCLSGDPGIYQSDDNISSGDSKEIAADNGGLDSTSQLAPSECVGHIFLDILPPSPSNLDYSVDEEDEFTLCDVSPVPMSDPWTGMSEPEYPVSHENIIDLDDDLDVPSDPCTFDDADGDDVMLLDFE